MNRRDFISAVAAALTAAVVPAVIQPSTLTLKKKSGAEAAAAIDFDPKNTYGLAVHVSERSEVGVRTAKEMLIASARKHLPPGTRFYVLDGGEFDVFTGEGNQHIDAFAWLYTPEPLLPPRIHQVIAEVIA